MKNICDAHHYFNIDVAEYAICAEITRITILHNDRRVEKTENNFEKSRKIKHRRRGI